jgi:hypothetical protein
VSLPASYSIVPELVPNNPEPVLLTPPALVVVVYFNNSDAKDGLLGVDATLQVPLAT